MKIGIVGNGFVGKATRLLENKHDTFITYDKSPELCTPLNTTLEHISRCDLIFVSVPTPMEMSGKCHIGIVQSVVNELQSINPNSCIIVRSTVPPGTCDALNCYFMPEFLTERNFETDFRECKEWIFGMPENPEQRFKELVTELFNNAHKAKCISHSPLRLTFIKNKEAEMIKYVRNTFLATKVSFFNEIEEFCTKSSIDYETVRKLSTSDERIGSSHSMCPGHDGLRGYGGTCFPKDIRSFLHEMKELNMESYIIQNSILRNEQMDRPNKDWVSNKGRSVL